MIGAFAIVERVLGQIGTTFDRLSVIELNRSLPPQTTIALLVFLDDRPHPFAFFKATPNPGRAGSLKTEFENLTYLQRHGTPGFRRSIPAPLYFGEHEGLTVLAESAVPGNRMKDLPPESYYRSPAFRHHFRRVVEWLHAFHTTCAGNPAEPVRAKPGNTATAALRRYRETHRVSPRLEPLLSEAEVSLRDARLPWTPGHADFCAANIVLSETDRIQVIDWEHPLDRSWPLSDLLYFVSSTWSVPSRSGPEAKLENYRRWFFEDHRLSGLLREQVGLYLDGLGVPRRLALALSVLAWAGFANRKHDEMAAARAVGENESRHLPLILIEDGLCLNLELLAERRPQYALIG